MGKYSEAEARAALATRLEGRQKEAEEVIVQRLTADDASGVDDPEYQVGLRRSVPVGVAYGIAAIRLDDGEMLPIPPELLIQARTAARYGVPVDAVLQRYIASRSIFDLILLDELNKDPAFGPDTANYLTASASRAFEALTAAVSKEHARAAASKPSTLAATRLARIKRLLNGEPVRTDDLEYDFAVAHVGAVTEGAGALDCLRRIATRVDGQLLAVQPNDDVVWAWLGIRQPGPRDALLHTAGSLWPAEIPLGFGEFGKELSGWRRTHEQARVAFTHARTASGRPTSYADIALAHTVGKDELLRRFLEDQYLVPLETGNCRGKSLCETLHAYFTVQRNSVSAAAMLGVSRRTVANRLATVESQLERPLHAIALELEVAIRYSRISPCK